MYAEDFNCKHISGKDEKFENCRPVFYFLHTSSLLAFLNPIKLPLLSSSIMLHEAGVN